MQRTVPCSCNFLRRGMLDLHMSLNLFEMNSNRRLEFGVCWALYWGTCSISMLSFLFVKLALNHFGKFNRLCGLPASNIIYCILLYSYCSFQSTWKLLLKSPLLSSCLHISTACHNGIMYVIVFTVMLFVCTYLVLQSAEHFQMQVRWSQRMYLINERQENIRV